MAPLFKTRACFLLLALVLIFCISAGAQQPGMSEGQSSDRPYPRPRTMDLSNCSLSCFDRGWANFYDPDTFLLRLRKNQKVRVSVGWGELPDGITDPLGSVDHDGRGLVIIDPRGKRIFPRLNHYVLRAVTAGTYTVILRPPYRKRNAVQTGKVQPTDYDYRFDVITFSK